MNHYVLMTKFKWQMTKQTQATNDYYSKRRRSRLVVCHFHLEFVLTFAIWILSFAF